MVGGLLLWPNASYGIGCLDDCSWLPIRGRCSGYGHVVCLLCAPALLLLIVVHLRFFANRVLVSPPSHATPADSSVEWAYAFDVHTNAFFPLYLTLYLAQLFLVPIILKNNWICLFLSNTLYLAAYVLPDYRMIKYSPRGLFSRSTCMAYISGSTVSVLIFKVWNRYWQDCLCPALPFLVRTELLLAPLLPLFAAYVVSLLGFNVAKHVLPAYFGP